MSRTPPKGKPFEPGKSGNPKGRPRKLPALDTLLADILGYHEGETEETAKARKILEALYKKAAKGDVRAAEIILDRAYGKPKQSIAVTASAPIVGMIIGGEKTEQ